MVWQLAKRAVASDLGMRTVAVRIARLTEVRRLTRPELSFEEVGAKQPSLGPEPNPGGGPLP